MRRCSYVWITYIEFRMIDIEEDLSRARGFSARLQEGIGAVLDFLDRHLPEQFRPLVEKARELLPVPEVQQPEREQERSHTWGGMEL